MYRALETIGWWWTRMVGVDPIAAVEGAWVWSGDYHGLLIYSLPAVGNLLAQGLVVELEYEAYWFLNDVPDALRRIQGIWIVHLILEVLMVDVVVEVLLVLIPSTSEHLTHLCQSWCTVNLLRSPSVESGVANQDVYRDYLAELDSWDGILMQCRLRYRRNRTRSIAWNGIYDAWYSCWDSGLILEGTRSIQLNPLRGLPSASLWL